MKQLINRALCILLLLTACCVGSALADPLGDTCTDPPPQEVLAHIERNYPAYILEDYIAIRDTSKGDYGFALLSQQHDRLLVGYHSDGGSMVFWLRRDDAVPQGDGYAFFRRHTAGASISYGNTGAAYADDLGFDVIRIDKEHEEYWMQEVSYHWRNGAFMLYAYMDRTEGFEMAYVTDSGVSYYNFTEVQKLGRVSGTVQRDLRYVSYAALPKTHAQAESKLTVEPDIPVGELTAQSIKFTGGKKYAVYTAPSDSSLRGGAGRATVSTNDWIQVFGQEDGYILIQYAISSEQMRFGYIPASALPKNADVPTLQWRNIPVTITRMTALTDDPLNSQQTLRTLYRGTQVTLLGTMGTWAYVEHVNALGTWCRGFVPQSVLSKDKEFDLSQLSGGKASGTLTISGGRLSLTMAVSTADAPDHFLLLDDEHRVQVGYAFAVSGQPGAYQLECSLPADTTYLRFVPIQADGSMGETLFDVAW